MYCAHNSEIRQGFHPARVFLPTPGGRNTDKLVPVSLIPVAQSMLMPDDVSDLYAQALDDACSSCQASAAIDAI